MKAISSFMIDYNESVQLMEKKLVGDVSKDRDRITVFLMEQMSRIREGLNRMGIFGAKIRVKNSYPTGPTATMMITLPEYSDHMFAVELAIPKKYETTY